MLIISIISHSQLSCDVEQVSCLYTMQFSKWNVMWIDHAPCGQMCCGYRLRYQDWHQGIPFSQHPSDGSIAKDRLNSRIDSLESKMDGMASRVDLLVKRAVVGKQDVDDESDENLV